MKKTLTAYPTTGIVKDKSGNMVDIKRTRTRVNLEKARLNLSRCEYLINLSRKQQAILFYFLQRSSEHGLYRFTETDIEQFQYSTLGAQYKESSTSSIRTEHSKLVKEGFAVGYKRSHYMIDPSLLHSSKSELKERLEIFLELRNTEEAIVRAALTKLELLHKRKRLTEKQTFKMIQKKTEEKNKKARLELLRQEKLRREEMERNEEEKKKESEVKSDQSTTN